MIEASKRTQGNEMRKPTAKDYKFQSDRAFIMRSAFSELENLRNFDLTADQIREEITRVAAEMEAALKALKPD